MHESKNILALEPYYGGSHKAWIDGWRKRSRHRIDLLTLRARKWKWRMRGAALAFAERLSKRQQEEWDGLIVTDMMNLAEFLALLRPRFDCIPTLLYFHENQLSYPLQEGEEINYHYAITNLVSALAATQVVFNSEYNRSDFFTGIREILGKMPDNHPAPSQIDDLEERSAILAPAVDLQSLKAPRSRDKGPPILLWNHRWEYDKQPDVFLRALDTLAQKGVTFRTIICGKTFGKYSPYFKDVKQRLGERVLYLGYATSRQQYSRLLAQSDIIVSTAIQEFFGISVVEAMYAGAFPILPRRLNYPNLVPKEHHADSLYEENRLVNTLEKAIKKADNSSLPDLSDAVTHYDWEELLPEYDTLLEKSC